MYDCINPVATGCLQVEVFRYYKNTYKIRIDIFVPKFYNQDKCKVNVFGGGLMGGLVHPQVTTPEYAIYVYWKIRHFEGNP